MSVIVHNIRPLIRAESILQRPRAGAPGELQGRQCGGQVARKGLYLSGRSRNAQLDETHAAGQTRKILGDIEARDNLTILSAARRDDSADGERNTALAGAANQFYSRVRGQIGAPQPGPPGSAPGPLFWRIFRQLLRASRGGSPRSGSQLVEWSGDSSALPEYQSGCRAEVTHEFRTLGANVSSRPPSSAAMPRWRMAPTWITLLGHRLRRLSPRRPYLYVAANSGAQPVSAGTWFDQVAKMNSWWKVMAHRSRPAMTDCTAWWARLRRANLASHPE